MPKNEKQPQMSKILIAEDQNDLREMMTLTLEFAGHLVASAADGEAAVLRAREFQPDLIIMDVHMPLLDGCQVCEQIKSDETLKQTPILLISGMANAEEIQAGLQAGAQEYMRKPFELNHLIERVDALLTEA